MKDREEKKERIYRYIQDYSRENKVYPSYAEIGEAMGLSSKASISRYIKEMESEGSLRVNGRRGVSAAKTVRVPIVGSIACGLPSFAEQNIEDFVDILKDDLGSGDFFVLRASGESMIKAGIHDGDLVIIRRQNTADEGQIVVALVEDEATLKRLRYDRENQKVILHPENPKFKDMYFDNVEIQGVAVRVLNNLE